MKNRELIEKIVDEIMDDGYIVAMGGDPFMTNEECEDLLKNLYEECLDKWCEVINALIHDDLEKVEKLMEEK